MAESYVTKFARTVKSNYESLKTNLKNKGIPVSANDTLGNLVEKVNDINLTFSYPKYERDENLPDIDALFEADTLRFANGGTYKGCSYFLCMLDSNNNITFYNSSTIQIELVKFSDGHTIDTSSQTSSTYNNYTVQSNGIFTDSNGDKYCWVAIYKTEPGTSSPGYTPTLCKEAVLDHHIGSLSIVLPTAGNGALLSDVIVPPYSYEQYLDYIRFVGSNTTKEKPYSSYVNINARFVQIDGFWNGNNGNQFYIYGNDLIEKYIINAEIVNTTNRLYISGDSVSSETYSSKLDYLKTPYSEQPIDFQYDNLVIRELYITDNVKNLSVGVTTKNAKESQGLEKLHLGLGLESISFSDASSSNEEYLSNLKHITVSEGAFGNNEDAYTLNLSAAFYLTRQSVLNLINGLADRTNKTANVLKLSTRSKSLVTDEEKAILTAKNWTIS